MKTNANGISPVVALVLTLLMAFFAIMLLKSGHVFWGIVFVIICVDFFADLLLSLKKS